MSTSETVHIDKGPCPCGLGRVIQHITTQDNPWSNSDIAYSVACARCSTEWHIDGSSLVQKASERPYLAACETEADARHALRTRTDRLVNAYFEAFKAPNKKAEHAEMKQLGITSLSYRQYLAHKRQGGTPASASYARRNESWLLALADDQSCKSELLDLMSTADRARDATRDAYSSITRWPIA